MKKEPRLLHVSCIVREDGEVWALLRALEACAAGNVEVKPVGGDIPTHVAAHMGLAVDVEPEQQRIEPPPPSLKALVRLPVPNGKGKKGKRAWHPRTAPGHTAKAILATMQHHVPIEVGEIIRRTGFSGNRVYQTLHGMVKNGMVIRQATGIYVRNQRAAS